MNHAAELRILETIDILRYTFKVKPKGASLALDKKFLMKLRAVVIGSTGSFISRNWLPDLQITKFSKIHDLRFPTAFFALKKHLPNVICELIVGYMGPNESHCSLCQCDMKDEEKHYRTVRHQNNIKKTDLIPNYLQNAYSNTVRAIPVKKPKKSKK